MATPLDLDAYLERIKYTGSRKPTYDALTGILQAHIASIPFESFDVSFSAAPFGSTPRDYKIR